jgi:hypothetical protein
LSLTNAQAAAYPAEEANTSSLETINIARHRTYCRRLNEYLFSEFHYILLQAALRTTETDRKLEMSFGFSVGDFIAAGQLAWTLYRDYYRVARVAPAEVGLLRGEIGTLSNAIQILQEEVDDEESVLRRSGEDRIRMVNEMMERVADTLKELDKVSKKYDKLLEYKDKAKSKGKLSQLKEWRDKFKFSVDAPDLDALRNRVEKQRSFQRPSGVSIL